GASNKGKSPMIEEDIPVPARTFRQMEKDRLDEEIARRLHEEELAKMEREREEAQRKRQQESSAIYNTGWSMAYMKSFSDEQLLHEFEKIRKVHTQSQLHSFSKTFKRPGSVLEEPPTKKPKSPEEPIPSMPEIPIPHVVTSPPSSRTRRKSIARKPMIKPKSTLSTLDLDASAQTFLKVIVDENSNDKEYVDEVWSAVVGWELISTPLGEVNALYRINGTTKHFTTLRQILYLVDCQDLMRLYGLVVKYYEHHPAVGSGLLFWGDLQVLFDSQVGRKGSSVWQNQHKWQIQSWRLYTLSNFHVLETTSGEVLSMFTDVSYPLTVELMTKMLMQKLEIASDFVGNDLKTAEQLIQFLKNQIVAAQASSV
nr:aminoacyl-tRNA synthetase, class 1a, anticodon-binding [Tanacetum cinerariifolium]